MLKTVTNVVGNGGGHSEQNTYVRNPVLDIAKGLGIIFMVLGHAGCPYPIKKFICFFHMPLFFIISGYVFKDIYFTNFENVKLLFFKRIKSLYLPYVFCNLIYVLFNNFFIKINFYTVNSKFLLSEYGNEFGLSEILSLKDLVIKIFYIFLFSGGSQLGGATWFLRTLFWITIGFCFFAFILKKLIKNEKIFYIIGALICIICLLIGFYFSNINFNFYNIGTMFSVILLFYIGFIYKEKFNFIKIDFLKFILSFIVLLLFCFILNKYYIIVQNFYYNPVFLISTSIAGFIFTMYISEFISKLRFLSNILDYIGQNTISILCLHLLCFKIITLLQVLIYNQPDYMLAAFPKLYSYNYWWVLYAIVGICGSLLISFIYRKVKIFFKFSLTKLLK